MKSISPNLLLTPKDNKATIKLANGLELILRSELSTNVREALVQTGLVRASFDGEVQDYWSNLKYKNILNNGDLVFCSHLSFFETTAKKDGSGYEKREFIEVDGEELYTVDYREIYFRINPDNTIDLLGEYMLLEGVMEETFSSSFLTTPESSKKLNKYKARVVQVSSQIDSNYKTGDLVYFVDPHCLYKVEIDGNVFYRCRESEVVACERLENLTV